MKPKHLLILLLLGGGLATYIYFGIQKPAERKSADGSGVRALVGDLDALTKLQIEVKAGNIQVEKENNLWWLTNPVKDLASDSKVKNLITAMEKFRKIKTIKESATDLEQFGLKDPKVKLSYKTADRSEVYTAVVGAQNPAYTGSYAQSGSGAVLAPEVFLGGLDLDFLATQRADDFREMKLLTLPPENFENVQIKANGNPIILKKVDGNWVMTAPYHLPVDPEFVRGQIEKISLIRANSFLEKAPTGVKDVAVRINVAFQEGKSDLRTTKDDIRPNGSEILLYKLQKSAVKKKGSPKASVEESSLYYSKSDKTSWASISHFHLENLMKDPEDYIKKSFDDFLISDVEKISISRPASRDFQILRKSAADFEASLALNPPVAARAPAVEDILRQIRNLKALKFLDQKPRSAALKPSLTIRLHMKGNETRNYVFELKKDIGEVWTQTKNLDGQLVWLRYLTTSDPIKLASFDFDYVTKEPKRE